MPLPENVVRGGNGQRSAVDRLGRNGHPCGPSGSTISYFPARVPQRGFGAFLTKYLMPHSHFYNFHLLSSSKNGGECCDQVTPAASSQQQPASSNQAQQPAGASACTCAACTALKGAHPSSLSHQTAAVEHKAALTALHCAYGERASGDLPSYRGMIA